MYYYLKPTRYPPPGVADRAFYELQTQVMPGDLVFSAVAQLSIVSSFKKLDPTRRDTVFVVDRPSDSDLFGAMIIAVDEQEITLFMSWGQIVYMFIRDAKPFLLTSRTGL